MIKKLLHRITIVWCLYGLVRLCIFVNPIMFRLVRMVKPVFEDNSEYLSFKDVPWDSSNIEQIFVLWFLVAVIVGIVFLASIGIHFLADWFFNTAKNDEDEDEYE